MPRKPTTAAPTAPEPRKAGHRWIDLLVGGAAILISVISLVVAIQQGRIQQQMLAAGSWPILVSESSNIDPRTSTPVITMTVRNDGAGPALLRWIDVRYDGKPIANHVDLIRACCMEPGQTDNVTVTSSQLGRSVMAAGKSLDFLVMTRTDENARVWDRLNGERWKISYDACYCSVLKECWRSALDGGEPRPVKACPNTGGYRE